MWGSQRSLKADFEWHILGTSCGGVCVWGGFLCPEDNYPDGSTEGRWQRSQRGCWCEKGIAGCHELWMTPRKTRMPASKARKCFLRWQNPNDQSSLFLTPNADLILPKLQSYSLLDLSQEAVSLSVIPLFSSPTKVPFAPIQVPPSLCTFPNNSALTHLSLLLQSPLPVEFL